MKKLLFYIALFFTIFSYGQIVIPTGGTSTIGNTDSQKLSISNNIVTLENGGTMDLTPYLDNNNVVSGVINGTNLVLTLTGGGTVTIDVTSLVGGGAQNFSSLLAQGNDAGAVKISNLANGTNPQDAVTLSQLNAAISAVSTGASQAISIQNASATEGNNVVFTVSVDGGGAANSNIDFIVDTSDGTATIADADYQVLDGEVGSILSGETSTTITVVSIDDANIEPDENFTITISGSDNAIISNASATGTIINDDASSVENPFFLAANGVTIILKEGNPVGTTGLADNDPSGKTYTAVDNTTLFALDPATDDYTNICTTLVTNLTSLFQGITFNQAIGNWDVSNVTKIDFLFRESTFNQPIQWWDVSNVTSGIQAFRFCPFNQPIGIWDVSNFTSMSAMFQQNNAFNQDIGNWDVGSVNDMFAMFNAASGFNQDLSNWCVSQIATEPDSFENVSGWTLPKPNWGAACTGSSSSVSDGVISFFDTDVNVTEGVESTVTFVVNIGGSISENVTVDYTTSNGSANNGGDYTAQTGTITFTPSISSVNIAVPILDDAVFETTETFDVVLSNIQSNIGASFENSNSTLTATGNIIDNDTPTGNLQNLLSNGTFNDDSEWTLLNGATATGGVLSVPSNGRIQSSPANWSAGYYNIRPQSYYETRRYRLTFEGRCNPCGDNLDIGQRYNVFFEDPLTPSFETYVVEFDGSGSNTGNDLAFGGEGIGDVFELRNMKLEDIADNTAGGAGGVGTPSQLTYVTDFESGTYSYQQWAANGVNPPFKNQWEVDQGDPRTTATSGSPLTSGRDGTGTAIWLGSYNGDITRNEIGKDVLQPFGEAWVGVSIYPQVNVDDSRLFYQLRNLAPGGSSTVNAISLRHDTDTDQWYFSLPISVEFVDATSESLENNPLPNPNGGGDISGWNGAGTGTTSVLVPYNFQAWNDVVIHYKGAFGADYDGPDTSHLVDVFGYDPRSDGFIEIWVNGVKVVDHVGTTLYRYEKRGGEIRFGFTPKIGPYWSGANVPKGDYYYDNYSMYVGPNGSYGIVDPNN